MTTLLCPLLQVYLVVLVARAILSWFPLQPGSAIAPIAHFLYTITEPLLAPLRRIIPPIAGFDLSFLVLLFAIEIIHSRICGGGGIL